MPKKEIDYSKTIIYKIVCKDLNIKDLYVGHTTDFIRRKSQHKQNCNNPNAKGYDYNVYQFIRLNNGWENWEMIEIEKYPCNNFNEACSRERHWKELINGNLNSVNPIRTADDIKQSLTKYRKTEHGKKIKADMDKKYYEKNKTEILKYHENYYEENKDKIKLYRHNRQKIKFECPCGSTCSITDRSKHIKTKKHLDYINKNNN